MTKVSEAGAVFRSHIDGRLLELSPERAVAIQEALGSDVAMVLDHVVALPAERESVVDAMQRTHALGASVARCRAAHGPGPVRHRAGWARPELRAECAAGLTALDFAGYAVGGLSVGETPAEMYAVLDVTVPLLPADRPRYLMGVGTPTDLLEAIHRGIDLFDCVMPTRNGRNAMAFTDAGGLRLRNLSWPRMRGRWRRAAPARPAGIAAGYLRHLFMAQEMLGPILLSIHNLTYYQRLLAEARTAIAADEFAAFRERKLAGWRRGAVASEATDA